MKKIVILLEMMIIATVSMAQWEIVTFNNGFDKPKYYDYAYLFDETGTPFIKSDGTIIRTHTKCEMIKFGESPVLTLSYGGKYGTDGKRYNVKIVFKVNGVNKTYNVIGIDYLYRNLVLSPDTNIENITKLMKGQFLNDFRNASKMKIEVDDYIEVYNMRGSTNAYNKVKHSKNMAGKTLETIYYINKLTTTPVDITNEKGYDELRKDDKELILDCNYNEINIGDTVQHLEDKYCIIVTGKVETHIPHRDEYMAVGKLLTNEGDNNADNILFKVYNPKCFKKVTLKS